ncbi:DddA-like double-stranded DNA deaminase toxin [Actinokineospora globicatena]|uniref:DddA-like double-stranded DNA deaminase toxin n=1 Tax=Actinokineospora globicatena TaxID=103729 RepID=UPI0020A28548|nr:DddA-like double-stranded DNA deaminase toxin [Actinokineospora globicatena]MCP2302497.1 SCP1.201-like deaminase [Actinokineospora globicatena]GLW75818.1 hypothetical protein Aglo01_03000 [Actinokineospora globicatena]GLW82656.1 hypothetical protein Aglo02_02970 [Actinokineospora globicatena]
MAIPNEIRRLRQVRNGLLVKRGWTRGVELKVAEIEAEACRLLGDAARHSEVARSLAEVRAKLDALREALGLAIDLVGQAIAHHSRTTGLGSSPTSAAPRTIPPGPTSPVRGPAGAYVANQHGDLYPEEASPYHEALQRRVVRGSGMPIAGWIQLDGAHIGEITATPNDLWAEASAERMADLDPRRAAFVAHHVEMKVIAMMVSLGTRHGQVIINHAPCGSEQGDPPGCHTSIPRCLPTGRTLTVLGIDRNGNPFKHTYHGKAKW